MNYNAKEVNAIDSRNSKVADFLTGIINDSADFDIMGSTLATTIKNIDRKTTKFFSLVSGSVEITTTHHITTLVYKC